MCLEVRWRSPHRAPLGIFPSSRTAAISNRESRAPVLGPRGSIPASCAASRFTASLKLSGRRRIADGPNRCGLDAGRERGGERARLPRLGVPADRRLPRAARLQGAGEAEGIGGDRAAHRQAAVPVRLDSGDPDGRGGVGALARRRPRCVRRSRPDRGAKAGRVADPAGVEDGHRPLRKHAGGRLPEPGALLRDGAEGHEVRLRRRRPPRGRHSRARRRRQGSGSALRRHARQPRLRVRALRRARERRPSGGGPVRRPRRRSALSGALVALTSFACALTGNIGLLVAARFLQGLFIPSMTTCLAAYLSRALPPDRLAVVMGWYVSATVAGGLGGRLLGGFVFPAEHWRLAFVAAGALVGGAVVAALRWLPREPRRSAPSPEAAGFLALLARQELLRMFAVGFFAFFFLSAMFDYAPFYLSRQPL